MQIRDTNLVEILKEVSVAALGLDSLQLTKLQEELEPLHKGNAGEYLGLAGHYFNEGDYRAAAVVFERLMGAKPDGRSYIVAHLGFAGCCYLLDDYEGAADIYRKTIRLEPDTDLNSYAHLCLALCYEKQDDYDESVRLLERAVELTPYNGSSHYFLGEAYLGRKERWRRLGTAPDEQVFGEVSKALSQFRRAADLGNEDAKRRLEGIRDMLKAVLDESAQKNGANAEKSAD